MLARTLSLMNTEQFCQIQERGRYEITSSPPLILQNLKKPGINTIKFCGYQSGALHLKIHTFIGTLYFTKKIVRFGWLK